MPRLDIHRIAKRYESSLRYFEANPGISAANKELFHKFESDCRIGASPL